MKKKILVAFAVVLILAALLLSLFAANNVLMPKYSSESIPEGALIAEYYAEKNIQHDVLFVGDCEVYETFVPAKLWEEYGISSYVRGSAQQLVWQSYYLLKEMLSYEKPKVVVFNVLSLKYGEPQNEAYNRMTYDGMKLSKIKMEAVKASMTENESLLSYVFPILRYHSRWNALGRKDFESVLGQKKTNISHSGYLMQTDVVAQTVPSSEGNPLVDYTLPEKSMHYLDLMRKLCAENGAELVLTKAPTNNWKYYWYDEWDKQVSEYASEHSLKYYNLIEKSDEIGLDFTKDTYDAGVHLNVYGAEKVTSYFGKILKNDLKLEDNFSDPELSEFWTKKLEKYNLQKNN